MRINIYIFFFYRQMQLEFDTYRQTVEKVGEEAKKIVTADTGAVCEICHKTKFADGVGHTCAYCNLKSCARCGGRINVKNKVSAVRIGKIQTSEKLL